MTFESDIWKVEAFFSIPNWRKYLSTNSLLRLVPYSDASVVEGSSVKPLYAILFETCYKLYLLKQSFFSGFKVEALIYLFLLVRIEIISERVQFGVFYFHFNFKVIALDVLRMRL